MTWSKVLVFPPEATTPLQKVNSLPVGPRALSGDTDGRRKSYADHIMLTHLTRWLEERRELGALFIRVFMGTFLIYMSQDNVFDGSRMLEFERFLQQFGFPIPPVSARVSVYAQLACGVLTLLGAFTRAAAAVLIVNFVVALVMVHTRLPFREALDPAAMLAGSLFLLFNGAGVPSVDAWRARRRAAPAYASYGR